jgi:predicted RNA-binding Zn-ribbon protein involved in translation (DUF1610 family)
MSKRRRTNQGFPSQFGYEAGAPGAKRRIKGKVADCPSCGCVLLVEDTGHRMPGRCPQCGSGTRWAPERAGKSDPGTNVIAVGTVGATIGGLMGGGLGAVIGGALGALIGLSSSGAKK